jgi:sigma-B regulation protein RsbU (phosphoserine phosphatase)
MAKMSDDSLREQLGKRRDNLQHAIARVGREDQLVELLREVDVALEKVNSGTYGLCETCHDPIEEERLAVNPLIRNCLDHLTAAEQRMLEYDLDLAYQVQAALLPKQGSISRSWTAAHHYEPAGSVSGDYLDILVSDASRDAFLFLVGDVTGKGVAASILMSNLHAIFRTLSRTPAPLGRLLEQANRLFCEGTTSRYFATLACGQVAPDSSIEFATAGHPPPLLLTASGTQRIDAAGVPLGMFCSSTYRSVHRTTEPGDTLVLYSDGLTEARDAADHEYGLDRLAALVSGLRGESPGRIVEAVVRDLKTFRGASSKLDDLTLLVLQRSGPAAE